MPNNVFCIITSLLVQSFLPARAMLRFQVNLDEPPRKRWTHVATYWKNYLHAMGPQLETRVREKVNSDFDPWAEYSKRMLQGEREEELLGMLDAAGSGPLTMQHLLISNILYETGMPTLCTGVLAARPDGTVIHGRNMDFAFPFLIQDNATGAMLPQNWPDVTFDVTFYRQGKPLYTGTMWPGMLGMGTGMRFPDNGQGGWSFQLNARLNAIAVPTKINLEALTAQAPTVLEAPITTNLAAANQGGSIGGIQARRVLEDRLFFKDAVNDLYNARFAAPQYFVVGGAGPYEGSIITVDRLGQHKMYTPKPVSLGQGKWFLVQTNDDQKNIAFDNRRPWATKQLNRMEQKRGDISVKSTFHLMHTFPVLDGITVYTTVMVPRTGYYRTILPHEQGPDVRQAEGSCEACTQFYATTVKKDEQLQAPPQMQAPIPVAPAYAAQIAEVREAAERERLQGVMPQRPMAHQRQRLRGVMPGSLIDVTSFLQLNITMASAEGLEL